MDKLSQLGLTSESERVVWKKKHYRNNNQTEKSKQIKQTNKQTNSEDTWRKYAPQLLSEHKVKNLVPYNHEEILYIGSWNLGRKSISSSKRKDDRSLM